MTELTAERAKITAAHRARQAFVYVRQSSLQQVRRNRESQRRQYDFAAQATTLGWGRDRVVILDEDQGKSGAIPYARTGFGRLASAIASDKSRDGKSDAAATVRLRDRSPPD